jgi:hypothetical protein
VSNFRIGHPVDHQEPNQDDPFVVAETEHWGVVAPVEELADVGWVQFGETGSVQRVSDSDRHEAHHLAIQQYKKNISEFVIELAVV